MSYAYLNVLPNQTIPTLTGNITAGTTSISLSGWPWGATTEAVVLRCESEIMYGTISGTTFTATTRGAESTVAASHVASTPVKPVLTQETVRAAFSPGFINVAHNSIANLVADGSTDNSAGIASIISAAAAYSAGGVVLYFPAGIYQFTTTIDLSALNWVTMLGDGWRTGSSWGSILRGGPNNADLVKFQTQNGQIYMDKLYLKGNYSSLGLYGYPVLSAFTRCGFQSPTYGVYSPGNYPGGSPASGFDMTFRDCWFSCANTGIGLLIYLQTACILDNCLFQNCTEGVRAGGSGLSIYGGRAEVCQKALNLGYDPSGANYNLDRSFISGMSFEGNDYHIIANTLVASKIVATAAQGSTNAPSRQSITGFWIKNSHYCTFDAVNMGGSYSDYAIRIDNSAANHHCKLVSCSGSNSLHGSQLWALPSTTTSLLATTGYLYSIDGLTAVSAENSNNP